MKGEKRQYRLQPWFDKRLGPHRVAMLTGASEVWQKHVHDAVLKVQGFERKASEGAPAEVESESLDKAKKHKAKQAAAKTRVKLEEKQQQRESRRRVSLSGSARVIKPQAAPQE